MITKFREIRFDDLLLLTASLHLVVILGLVIGSIVVAP